MFDLTVRDWIAISSIVLGIMTLIPWHASEPNRIGYYSICSYTPFSSLLLFGIAAVIILYKK